MYEGFQNGIPLRENARNCAKNYRARNSAQVKSTCIDNPKVLNLCVIK